MIEFMRSNTNPMEVRYIKAHDVMSRNILTLQQDQEIEGY